MKDYTGGPWCCRGCGNVTGHFHSYCRAMCGTGAGLERVESDTTKERAERRTERVGAAEHMPWWPLAKWHEDWKAVDG